MKTYEFDAVVIKTNRDKTSLRYRKPDGMRYYIYIPPLDLMRGDIVKVKIEKEE